MRTTQNTACVWIQLIILLAARHGSAASRGHFGGSRKAWRMLLLLLSHISRVRLCATPQTAAHQAPASLGFSREEHWSGAISFSNAWKWSRSDSERPHGPQPTRLLRPREFPGKSTGVGCHCLHLKDTPTLYFRGSDTKVTSEDINTDLATEMLSTIWTGNDDGIMNVPSPKKLIHLNCHFPTIVYHTH